MNRLVPVECAVQILFSIFIAILKIKLNTVLFKNFFFPCHCRKLLTEEHTGNKSKENQILKNILWQNCAVICKLSNLNLASQ
jgi:hypothetical protein